MHGRRAVVCIIQYKVYCTCSSRARRNSNNGLVCRTQATTKRPCMPHIPAKSTDRRINRRWCQSRFLHILFRTTVLELVAPMNSGNSVFVEEETKVQGDTNPLFQFPADLAEQVDWLTVRRENDKWPLHLVPCTDAYFLFLFFSSNVILLPSCFRTFRKTKVTTTTTAPNGPRRKIQKFARTHYHHLVNIAEKIRQKTVSLQSARDPHHTLSKNVRLLFQQMYGMPKRAYYHLKQP